jgi:hypothetical protein
MIELVTAAFVSYSPTLGLDLGRFERSLAPDMGAEFRRLLVAVDDEAVTATLAEVAVLLESN